MNADLYGSRANSIDEEEKIRRHNVIKSFSSLRNDIEKDWIETYHEIFSERFDSSNEKKKIESSSQGASLSDSTISIQKNIDFPLEKNIGSCKSFDEMQDSSSTKLHSTMCSNTWSKTKDSKENKIANVDVERNRRVDILISFQTQLPGLERGEYIPENA